MVSTTVSLSFVGRGNHMWAIWEKGPLRAEAEFLILIVHNVKAVIATDLKPGITILQSLHYTRRKFRAPPTSGLGVAITSITQSKIGCFMPPIGAPPFQVGRQLHFLMLDFFSGRAGVPINQDWSLRLLVSSSYDRLKTVKFWRFVRSGPFSQIRSHVWSGTLLLLWTLARLLALEASLNYLTTII